MAITYLTDLFTTRELSAAVLRYCNEDIELNLVGLSEEPLPPCLSPDVSPPISEIALLVLNSIEIPEHEFQDEPPTESGTRVLASLHTAIFGHSCSLPQNPSAAGPAFMRHIFAGTSSQARRAFRLCLAALIDSVSPKNALSMYNLASTAACSALATVAARAALAAFSQVSVQDYLGLVRLPEPDLLALLSSNNLNIESEVSVFNALVSWVEYDLPERLAGFVGKLARTVRLGQMSIQELAFLDSHPLVSGDRLAVALVANVYLCKLMNIPYENPYGMEDVASGPRRSHSSSGSSSSDSDSRLDTNRNNNNYYYYYSVLSSGSHSSEMEEMELEPSSSSSMATAVCRVAGHVHRSAIETVICALRTIQSSQADAAAAAVEAESLLRSEVKQQQEDISLEETVNCFGALSVDRRQRRPSPGVALFADGNTSTPAGNKENRAPGNNNNSSSNGLLLGLSPVVIGKTTTKRTTSRRQMRDALVVEQLLSPRGGGMKQFRNLSGSHASDNRPAESWQSRRGLTFE